MTPSWCSRRAAVRRGTREHKLGQFVRSECVTEQLREGRDGECPTIDPAARSQIPPPWHMPMASGIANPAVPRATNTAMSCCWGHTDLRGRSGADRQQGLTTNRAARADGLQRRDFLLKFDPGAGIFLPLRSRSPATAGHQTARATIQRRLHDAHPCRRSPTRVCVCAVGEQQHQRGHERQRQHPGPRENPSCPAPLRATSITTRATIANGLSATPTPKARTSPIALPISR